MIVYGASPPRVNSRRLLISTLRISYENNIISFAESIFYDGEGTINVLLYSIDEAIYNYFLQMNDILFWKRRILPPSPYNPTSNLSNGALGYFAAWAIDVKQVVLEW